MDSPSSMASTNQAPPAACEAPAAHPAPAPSENGETLTSDEGAKAVNPDANSVSPNGGEAEANAEEEEEEEEAAEAEEEPEVNLAIADELFERGSKAIEDGDFVEAVDSLSRALEIRVTNFGELAEECATSYYKYGYALLYKAQEEASPLGDVPKCTPKDTEKTETTIMEESGGSKASASGSTDPSNVVSEDNENAEGSCDKNKECSADGTSGSAIADKGNEVDDEDVVEAEEDESDLDLAWKMLDIARVIFEKNSADTMEKVKVYSALAEVSMEREDIETSLNDYLKALAIAERLVESDHRRVVELNFRISLVLELGSRIKEAIPYCEKAISLCKSHLQRLKDDAESAISESETKNNLSTAETSSKSSEIDFFTDILSELEKKLEDMELQAVPLSKLSEYTNLATSNTTDEEKNPHSSMPRASSLSSSQIGVLSGGFDSPTISTDATNGAVTHLGVVGRGVKRATIKPKPISAEPSPKKPALEKSTEDADGSASETPFPQ